MDWGTPRLVTKNRQINMTGKQLESRSLLLGMASVRTGNKEPVRQQPKQDFAQTSVSNFRKKMMEEEKASEDHEEGPERRISYGMLPKPETMKDRSASIADV